MNQFIPVETPSGIIWAEVEENSETQGIILTGRTDRAFHQFEDAARALKGNADFLIKMFADLSPQEVTISFGISVGAEAGNSNFWAGESERSIQLFCHTEMANWKRHSCGHPPFP